MSKLKKLGKAAGYAAGAAGLGYAIKKGHQNDKKIEERRQRKDDHQELKNMEKHGSKRAKSSAAKYRKEKGIGPKGGKVKFIRKNGRLIPIREK